MATKALIRRNNGFPNVFNDLVKPWESFFNTEDSLFKGFFGNRTMSVPSVNIEEKDKAYEISVAAPGLVKDDFSIDVEGDMLTIGVEKKSHKEVKEDRFTRQEFDYTSFSRSFSLPDWVVKDKIDARYDNGLLIVTLPTTEQKQAQLAKHVTVK